MALLTSSRIHDRLDSPIINTKTQILQPEVATLRDTGIPKDKNTDDDAETLNQTQNNQRFYFYANHNIYAFVFFLLIVFCKTENIFQYSSPYVKSYS
jgi:hypothetical protein